MLDKKKPKHLGNVGLSNITFPSLEEILNTTNLYMFLLSFTDIFPTISTIVYDYLNKRNIVQFFPIRCAISSFSLQHRIERTL